LLCQDTEHPADARERDGLEQELRAHREGSSTASPAYPSIPSSGRRTLLAGDLFKNHRRIEALEEEARLEYLAGKTEPMRF
jgi:hypothetical protein